MWIGDRWEAQFSTASPNLLLTLRGSVQDGTDTAFYASCKLVRDCWHQKQTILKTETLLKLYPFILSFLTKILPPTTGVEHWPHRPSEQHTALILHIPVLALASLPREHQAGPGTAQEHPGAAGPGLPWSWASTSRQHLSAYLSPELGEALLLLQSPAQLHSPFCSQLSWKTSTVWLRICLSAKEAPKTSFLCS